MAHGDGSRDNNSATNLRWATAAENAADRRAHGTMHTGEKNPAAKLSDAARSAIRISTERGDVLAERYEVSQATIVRIRGRRRAPDRRSRSEARDHFHPPA